MFQSVYAFSLSVARAYTCETLGGIVLPFYCVMKGWALLLNLFVNKVPHPILKKYAYVNGFFM